MRIKKKFEKDCNQLRDVCLYDHEDQLRVLKKFLKSSNASFQRKAYNKLCDFLKEGSGKCNERQDFINLLFENWVDNTSIFKNISAEELKDFVNNIVDSKDCQRQESFVDTIFKHLVHDDKKVFSKRKQVLNEVLRATASNDVIDKSFRKNFEKLSNENQKSLAYDILTDCKPEAKELFEQMIFDYLKPNQSFLKKTEDIIDVLARTIKNGKNSKIFLRCFKESDDSYKPQLLEKFLEKIKPRDYLAIVNSQPF